MNRLRRSHVATLLLSLVVALPSVAAGHPATVTVRSGDTLGAIAARVGSTPAELTRTNRLADPNRIVAGTRLHVPGHGPGAAGTTSPPATHVVRTGETLAIIAGRSGVSVSVLARTNGILNPNVVPAGVVLRLPGFPATSPVPPPGPQGTSHIVRQGETLASIAGRAGTTADALARSNGIANPNVIVVGTTLRLPGAPPPPATASPAAVSRSDVAVLLDAASARHGVNASLSRAVAWQESGWTQSAVSSAGALGVMQLMPGTAAWAGPALLGRNIDARSATDNIDAGVAFLAHLVRATGDVPTALAAYNQGLASVQRRGLFRDTRLYVAGVQALIGRV